MCYNPESVSLKRPYGRREQIYFPPCRSFSAGGLKGTFMKILIASDIHGSKTSTKLLLEAFESANADVLLILGDILYHGPRNDLPEGYAPKEVASLLNGYKDKIISVRGNCEAEVDQMMLEFPALVEACHIIDGENRIFACHGHKKELMSCTARGTFVLSGHTHVPLCEEREGRVYINPGSVSIPKEGSSKSYILYEDGVFTWYSLTSGEAYLIYG